VGAETTQSDVQSRLYGAIVEQIISGQLAAGERLVEENLAATYKISRTPVREVLFALEKDGLIERVRNQGARVIAFTPADVEEVFDVRKALECFSIANAVRTVKLSDWMELERRLVLALSSRKRATAESELADIDITFHRLIVEGSGNRRLVSYVEHVSLLLRSLQMAGYRKAAHVQESAEEHLAVLRALLRRDPAEAQNLLAAHIEQGKRHALELFFDRTLASRSN
jgi:DNA-binding GntR family transcriptional regulator